LEGNTRIRWWQYVPLLALIGLLGAALVRAEADSGPSNSSGKNLEIRVMTYNIKTLTLGLDANNWWLRRGPQAKLIRGYAPDLIGMQEVYTGPARDLAKRLPGYAWFGLPRDDGRSRGERCPIFYRRDRFELLDQATFWLSETPDRPGPQAWGAGCRRVVTWGKFRDKLSGQIFFHFNTHFDHVSGLAREKSAKLLVERIHQIAGKSPVFVTGDFNTTDTTPPYQTITALLRDARLVSAAPPEGPEGTFAASQIGPPEERIDFIFVSPDLAVRHYQSITDGNARGRRPSDHLPVLVQTVLELDQ
jgi:endonuclease/exonuclease/phosphatase family metal-dependent hydrolase